MRESATANDTDYLLLHTEVSPLRFRVVAASTGNSFPGADSIINYLQAHPGETVSGIRRDVEAFSNVEYAKVRRMVASLVKMGNLAIDGQAPLDQLDLRYERVAACAVCGSSSADHPIVFWKHSTPVVRCKNCNLLYSNPRWKAEYIFASYDNDYWRQYSDEDRLKPEDQAAAHWLWRLETLEPARKNGRLLDIGCATGEFLDLAVARNWDAYGVETSTIGGAHAARNHPDHVHVGTLGTAPWPDGMFDLVTLWDVIEHLPRPQDYIARAAALVRPGGLLAITTPNIRSLSYILRGRNWPVVGPNSHIYYFAPRTLARLLAAYGFAIHSLLTAATSPDTWRSWLHYRQLQHLAPLFQTATAPISNRLLLGDELYLIARRTAK